MYQQNYHAPGTRMLQRKERNHQNKVCKMTGSAPTSSTSNSGYCYAELAISSPAAGTWSKPPRYSLKLP